MTGALTGAARALTGCVYVVLGWDALRAPGGRVDAAGPLLAAIRNTVPLPIDDELVVRLNAAAQVVGGTALGLGAAPRGAALVLAASMVPTTLAGHQYWAVEDAADRKAERIHFWKNVGLTGGLLGVVAGRR